MTSQYVRLSPDGRLEWALKQGGRIVLRANPAPGVEHTTFLAPGEDVMVRRLAIVARSESDMRSTALFQIEEELAQSPEDIHVALGATDRTTRIIWFAAVSRSKMDSWTQLMAAAGFPSVAIVPETTLVSAEEMEIVEAEGRWLLSLPDRVVALGSDLAPVCLPRFLAQHAEALVLARGSVDQPGASPQDIQNGGASLSDASAYFSFAGRRLGEGFGINLRQAAYGKRGRTHIALRTWTAVASLAAALVLMTVVVLGVETFQLSAKADQLHKQSMEAYQRAFPDEQRVVNLRAQLRTKLGDQRGSKSSFLDLVAVLAAALEQVADVELRAIRYDAAEATLRASVALHGLDSRELLRSKIEQAGGVVELGVARQMGDAFHGEIAIQLP